MQKFFIISALFFVSCSQSFIEETQEAVYIDIRVSYNTMSEGISLNWETQRDFVRTEILKGETPSSLSILLDNVTQEELLDVDTIPNKDYYYQLKAYNSRDRQIGQSSVVKGYRSYRSIDDVVIPTDLIASQNEYSDQIEIFWLGDSLDRFRVYKASLINRNRALFSEFQLIAEIGFNNTDRIMYVDKNVLSGREYQYKIASVGQDTSGTVSEKFTDPFTGSTLNAPNGLTATKKYELVPGGINLTWTEDSEVSYYKIYRSDAQIDGEYVEIDPYIKGNSFIDTSMPNLEGTVENGKFTYPSYFYKIKSVNDGDESAFSTAVEGQAINPKDYLSPPNITFTVDKKVRQVIQLTWNTRSTKPYQVSEIDLSSQFTNIIVNSQTSPITQLEYKHNYAYLIRYCNIVADNLPGEPIRYNAVIPSPPTLTSVSTGARIYTTNETVISPPKETHIYWKNKGSSRTSMVGMITKEWIISSTGSFINLKWEPSTEGEKIDFYTVYRKKQGDPTFNIVTNKMTETVLRDKSLNNSQLQGTGTGGNFKYPIYEYQITATYKDQESAPSDLKGGSAVFTDDIISTVVPYVSVPFHWAKGFGFGSVGDKILRKGENSPQGFDNIPPGTKEDGNAMYLAWGDITGVSRYRVKHLVGGKTSWYDHGNSSSNFKWFNNESLNSKHTALYVWSDGSIFFYKYAKNEAQFNVAPVSDNGIVGYEKVILFEEPDTKPDHY